MKKVLLYCILFMMISKVSDAQVTVFRNCKIVSSHTPSLSALQDLIVNKGKIASIVPANELKRCVNNKDTSIIDTKGMYIIPGLIDAHIHLTTTKYASRDERLKALNRVC